MLSDATQVQNDGKVHCLIVHEDIPADICATEQGAAECYGCTAPTRRCVTCGQANGIHDAEAGRCQACATAFGEAKSTSSAQLGCHTLERALVSTLNQVRSIMAEEDAGAAKPASWVSAKFQDPTFKAKPAVLSNLLRLHAYLMEHAVHKNGVWSVSVPARVLCSHESLMMDEAKEGLAQLAKEQYLAGKPPWDEVVLLKTAGIEGIKARLENPRGFAGQSEPGARRSRIKARHNQPTVPSGPGLPATPVASVSESGRVAGQTPTGAPHSPAPVPRSPTVVAVAGTYADAFADLKQGAQRIGNEWIVRGALPMLQMKLRIGVPLAMAIMAKFENEGHILKRDGWRSVALLRESIDDATPLQIVAVAPKPATVSTAPPAPSRPPVVKHPDVSPPLASRSTPTPSVEAGADPLAVAIAALEAHRCGLQEMHAGVARELQAVETSLEGLRRAQSRGASMTAEMREALKQSALANLRLLAVLGQG